MRDLAATLQAQAAQCPPPEICRNRHARQSVKRVNGACQLPVISEPVDKLRKLRFRHINDLASKPARITL